MNSPAYGGTVPVPKGSFIINVLLLLAALSCIETRAALGATKTWTGGGGDFAWQNAANWSEGILPDFADDIIINAPGEVTITNAGDVSIKSIQCTNNLTLFGTFAVTAGPSVVQGAFTIARFAILSVSGVGTTFEALGPVFVGSDGGFEVTAGAVVRVPGLRRYLAGFDPVWLVNGAGSVLDLPGLTNVAGSLLPPPYSFHLSALDGGHLLLSNLVTCSNHVTVVADGAGSRADLSALQQHKDGQLGLSAAWGGTILTPQLAAGAQMRVSAFGTDSSVVLTSLTNADNGFFEVMEGAVMIVPALRNYAGTGGGAAYGEGSALDLSGLTNLAGPATGLGLGFLAAFGGQVLLGNLETSAGHVNIEASDGTSLVDVSSLQRHFGGQLWLAVQNGATTVLPRLETADYVNAYAYGPLSSLVLTSLTNADGGSFEVNEGAMVTAPALRKYRATRAADWRVRDPNSVLDLPGLAHLAGAPCCSLNLNATNGGQLQLPSLETIQDGYVSVISDGAGSLMDLSKLSGFVIHTGRGELIATNNGTLLLNAEAFLLANVAVHISPANPVLPPVLVPSPALTLYGNAWHSYMVEKQDTSSAGSSWTLAARVPLTTGFQALASSAPADTAFRVIEFVADPPLLDLWRTGPDTVELVLYGANKTYVIESAAALTNETWTPETQVVMSNAFRIFPASLTAERSRFYRAQEE